MVDYTKFDKYAPQMIADLMHDFGFTDWQAAAFPGNGGAESAGFTDIIEDGALAKGWAGGTGWFQWTGLKAGQRRALFEAWCKRKGLRPDSYEANYSFLYRELKGFSGTESGIVQLIKNAKSLDEASNIVCSKFLRPAVNNYSHRSVWSRRALEKYRSNPPKPTVWKTDIQPDVVIPKPPVPPVIPVPPAPQPLPPSVGNKTLEEILAMLPAVLINALIAQLPNLIAKAVEEATRDRTIPLNSSAPREAGQEVAQIVMDRVMSVPEVRHATNTETKWYQQRSKWASIVSLGLVVATPLLTKYGFDVSPENQDMIIEGCMYVGGVWTAYLAYRAGTATRPLQIGVTATEPVQTKV